MNCFHITETCFAKQHGLRFALIVAVFGGERAAFAQVFACAMTCDEVLDWRMMRDHYAGAKQHIIEGGDHAISVYEKYVEPVAAFCVS